MKAKKVTALLLLVFGMLTFLSFNKWVHIQSEVKEAKKQAQVLNEKITVEEQGVEQETVNSEQHLTEEIQQTQTHEIENQQPVEDIDVTPSDVGAPTP